MVSRALISLTVLAALAAACTSSTSDAPEESSVATTIPEPAASAPDGSAPDVPGRSYRGVDPAPEFPAGLDWLNTASPLSLAELRGKVVVLDFWTYGCINCIHIIPDLERLEREFADELVVIGVHSAKFAQEGETDNIRNVVLRYGLEHPVVNDRDFEVWRTWGARAWPTTAVIDPAGNVVGAHEGEGVYGVLQPVILSLVNEFAESGELDTDPIDFSLEREGLPQRSLSFPGKVHADPAQDRLFVADTNHHRVVTARISDGEVLGVYGSGVAGFADGAASQAQFDQPQGIALDPDGGVLYVADTGNHAVRTVDLATGEVGTLAGTGVQGRFPPAGGTGTEVALHSPWDVTLAGETLHVAMAGSHQLWTIDVATAVAAPFAGNGRESTRNGPAGEAELAQPSGVTLGEGRLYFADSESSSIRFVDLAEGTVDVLAGSDANLFDFGDEDGVGTEARLQHPLGVSWYGGVLYVADTYNSKLKAIDPTTGEVTTLFGGEAGWRDGTDPRFYEPGGLHVVDGVAYVADTNNHVVRMVDLATGEASTLLLTGAERFTPAGAAREVVDAGAVTVAPGAGSIVLDVTLPTGHKVNEDAPSSVTWTVGGGIAGLDVTDLTGTELPAVIPVEWSAGSGTLAGDLTLIWCADDAESLCFIEQLGLTAQATVADGGAAEVRFRHEITLPEL